jgi:hypothetical protein
MEYSSVRMAYCIPWKVNPLYPGIATKTRPLRGPDLQYLRRWTR